MPTLTLTRSLSQRHHSNQQATWLAWGLTLISLCLFCGLYWAGQAALLVFVYPFGALVLGTWLYLTHPALYLGFVLWIWTLTPFVRRLLDYQMGSYSSISPAMTAPILVTALTVVTILRHVRRLPTRSYLPFLLAFLGIGYGYAIGVLKNGPVSATLSMANWLLPVGLAFQVSVFWKLYPDHSRIMRSAFCWIMIVTGAYGIAQFLHPMPWDAMWMTGSMMQSIGHPNPFEVRVFSMLNSPGPYAMVALAGLVVLFAHRGILARIATGIGVGGFLLSLVRSAWGGWVVALGYMIFRSQGVMRKRLVLLLCACIVLSIPLFSVGSIANQVSSRSESLTALQEDNSFLVRLHFLGVSARWVLTDPIGDGLGSVGSTAKLSTGSQHQAFDNGIFSILFSLGWLGGGLFYAALFLLLRRMWRIDGAGADPSTVVFSAIAVAFVASLFFTNTLAGVSGIMAWTGLGLTLASGRYHGVSVR
jgi:hypothetical protein